MFSVKPFEFGGETNGFQILVMQSAEDRDRLIAAFERYVDAGYNPNDIIDRVFEEEGIEEKDLLDSDIAILNKRISEYYNKRR